MGKRNFFPSFSNPNHHKRFSILLVSCQGLSWLQDLGKFLCYIFFWYPSKIKHLVAIINNIVFTDNEACPNFQGSCVNSIFSSQIKHHLQFKLLLVVLTLIKNNFNLCNMMQKEVEISREQSTDLLLDLKPFTFYLHFFHVEQSPPKNCVTIIEQ